MLFYTANTTTITLPLSTSPPPTATTSTDFDRELLLGVILTVLAILLVGGIVGTVICVLVFKREKKHRHSYVVSFKENSFALHNRGFLSATTNPTFINTYSSYYGGKSLVLIEFC